MAEVLANIHCPHCRAIVNVAADHCRQCGKPITWFKKFFAQRVYCPNMASCPMFSEFQTNGALKLFIGAYCIKDFAACERKKRGDAGEAVPNTLLPNGQSLHK